MANSVIQRNNVNISGKGTQPMVFAHGYGCDQTMWRFVAPAFEEDFKVVKFDHVGSGKSDLQAYDFTKYNSLQGYADDVNEICEELDLNNVIFVGHSVSSMIGILAAASNPERFAKLVLVGPSPCYINKGNYVGGFEQSDIDELVATLESNYLGWSSYITPVIIGDPDKPEFSEELNTSFCSMKPEIAKHFAKVTFTSDNRDDLQRVQTPSLIIQSHPDVIAPVEVGKFLHNQLKNSAYEQISTVGHCPHLTAPDHVIAAMRRFIK